MPPKDVGCMPRKLYSPECVEKLFRNSEWVPNRGYESGQEGSKESRSAASWRQRSALQTPSAIFQSVSEGVFLEVQVSAKPTLPSARPTEISTPEPRRAQRSSICLATSSRP